MNLPKSCGALVLSILLLAGPLSGQSGGVLIPGDFDGDGDVDFADFAVFQTCVLGPDVSQLDPLCADARLDVDEDVDADDFAVLQGCLSGADNPADPSCACPSGETNCDGTCVDTASDIANCGACGNTCGAGLTCQNGSCAACAGGGTYCSGGCTNVAFDTLNCGGCGIVCADNETCSGGTCQSPWRGTVMIPGDFDDDGDIDLADFAHFQTCALGAGIAQTAPECLDAQLDADQDVDLEDFEVFHGCLSGAGNPADPNCACLSDETNCDGTCVTTASDEAHCGDCGNACAAGTTCLNGTCAGTCAGPCYGGQLCCDGFCREVQLDPSHCGGCFIQCGPGQNCAGGLCQDAEPPGG